MSIQPLVSLERPGVARESTKGDHAKVMGYRQTQAQTPPSSSSGSPRVEPQGMCPENSQAWAPLPPLRQLDSTLNSSPILPSLGEFDQGVESLTRAHGPVNPWTPPSPPPSFLHSFPLPRLSQTGHIIQPMTPSGQSWPTRGQSFEAPTSEVPSSRRGTLTSLSQYALASDKAHQPPPSPMASSPVTFNTINYHWHGSPPPRARAAVDSYPSPPPEGENRHINQKYTTEEGDFIIYAWHDRKMKWQRIKQEFATRFGSTPERTVQGLQAWYYRMNLRIPVWDKNGWLCFDDDDTMEPRHVSIKCRERDSQDKPMEPLGLAQRYPERAVLYPWVDMETKNRAQDWATKRASQFQNRRDRRRRKEQRRLKL